LTCISKGARKRRNLSAVAVETIRTKKSSNLKVFKGSFAGISNGTSALEQKKAGKKIKILVTGKYSDAHPFGAHEAAALPNGTN